VAAVAAIIASATSIMVHLPLIARAGQWRLTRQLSFVTAAVILVGIAAALFQQYLLPGMLNDLYQTAAAGPRVM
jgi:hypothetical protein